MQAPPLSVRSPEAAYDDQMRRLGVLASVMLLACGGDDPASPEPGPPIEPPPVGCSAWETTLEDGSCQRAGVPASACAEGFEHDGVAACLPVLPEAACPPGSMALPGETTCRAVAPCEAFTGDATTEYVDASYLAGDGDGSESKPWPTIQQGVNAAAPGGTVFVAAGSYAETVVVQFKGVTIRGTCVDEVIVDGGAETATFWAIDGAHGTVVRDLSVTGGGVGVLSSDALDVVVERVRIFDTGERAVQSEDSLGPASIVVRDCLLENNTARGIVLAGTEGVVERVVVRDVAPMFDGTGYGVLALPGDATNARLTVRRSVIEGTSQLGLGGQAAEVLVEEVVVRRTTASPEGFGRCVEMQSNEIGEPGQLTLRRSFVEDCVDVGVLLFGSTGLVEDTAVRGVVPDAQGRRGAAFGVENDYLNGTLSAATLLRSTAYNTYAAGVLVIGSSASLDGMYIADTQPSIMNNIGRSINAEADPETGDLSYVDITRSHVVRAQGAGIVALSAEATITATLVETSLPVADSGLLGDGIASISTTFDAKLTVTDSAIVGSARAGLSVFGATLSAGNVQLECNGIDINGETFGGRPFSLTDLGGMTCGCKSEARDCKASSTGLAPPAPL
jgi:hypothetical protein